MLPLFLLAIESEGDREFMCTLYARYHRLLFAQAYKVLSDPYEAEDAVEEAFEKFICKISRLRAMDCCTLPAYLVISVRHIAVNHKKSAEERHKSGRDPEAVWEVLPADDAPVDEGLLRRARVEQLMAALERLSERDQEILRMKYILELPAEEMGEALGVKPDSVRALLARARQRALKILQEVEKDDG